MEFNNVIMSRKSVKEFTNEQIPENKLKSMLTAASLAPSWKNHQCWKFIMVNDQNTKDKIASILGSDNSAQNSIHQAPLLAIICAQPHLSNQDGDKDYYLVDSAIAMEHLVLAASNEGLGTCWIGEFDEDKMRSLLKIPREYRIIAMTPIGYPKNTPDSENKRKIEDIAFLNQWGGGVLH